MNALADKPSVTDPHTLVPRLVQFVGEAPDKIGRFGIVNPGDILHVDEDEYQTAIRGGRFIDGSGVVEEGTEEQEVRKIPGPTNHKLFDLRTIHWEKTNLRSRLLRRSKPVLNKIAKAMEDLSGLSLPYGQGVSRNEIVNALVATARVLKWNELRMSLP